MFAFVTFNAFIIQAISALILCYYGNRVTLKPLQLVDTVYNSCWYNWPTQQQHGLRMMIHFGRKELYFSGYGFVRCSLETFQILVNKVSSYFVILRSME